MVVELRIRVKGDDIVGWLKGITTVKLPRLAKGITIQTATQIAKLARKNVKERAIQQTGRLADSIKVAALGTGKRSSYSVVALAPYAMYVEQGTKPHVIPGIPHWAGLNEYGGRIHPGSRAMYFMRDALETTFNNINNYIESNFTTFFK